MTFLRVVLGVQILTYMTAGFWFLWKGPWPLGMAQLLLAMVQGLVFGPSA